MLTSEVEGLVEVPKDYAVGARDVHVWKRCLGSSAGHIEAMSQILSADERQRTERFHFQVDRERHVVGRALARTLLGQLLGIGPPDIRFCTNEFGKPSVAPEQNRAEFQFNISHSGIVVLLALTAGRAVGVDVEQIRENVEIDALAERFFSPRERADLASVAPDRRRGAFFACWSRKEAFIKATGAGLFAALDCFDVSVKPDEPAMLLQTRPDPAEAGRWTMRDLDVGPGHKAALVAAGLDWQLETMGGWPPHTGAPHSP